MLSDEALRIAYSTTLSRGEKVRRLRKIAELGDAQVKGQVTAYFRSFAMEDNAKEPQSHGDDSPGIRRKKGELTEKEEQVLGFARAQLSTGRISISASYIAQKLGWTPRSAAGVLRSLDNKGLLRGLETGFVGNKTWVYVLADPKGGE